MTRATVSCSRNDNVGGDHFDRGSDYDFAARDDDHHRPDNHHHASSLHLHTSRHDNYTCRDDHERQLDYDASRLHNNATSHNHLNARSVSLRCLNTTLYGLHVRSLFLRVDVGVVVGYVVEFELRDVCVCVCVKSGCVRFGSVSRCECVSVCETQRNGGAYEVGACVRSFCCVSAAERVEYRV